MRIILAPNLPYTNQSVPSMRRWLNTFMALVILAFTLLSFGCAGTSGFTECESPAFSTNSNCMNNLRYYERFGY